MSTIGALTSERSFVRACSRTASGVNIVTTASDEGQIFGQTVSAVTRVSDEPAVLGVCIQSRSPLNDVLTARRRFNVSALSASQSPVADSFAGRGTESRPSFTFLPDEWSFGDGEIPLLKDAAAHFECELIDNISIGSHWLYLGRVFSATSADAEPLLYLRGSYRELAPTSEGHDS